MKKIYFTLSLGLMLVLLNACGERAKEEQNEVVVSVKQSSKLSTTNAGVIDENVELSALDLSYTAKLVEATDPKCLNDLCTHVSLEFPSFEGEGAEEANRYVNRKVSEFVGAGSNDYSAFLDVKDAAPKFFDYFYKTQLEDPDVRPWFAQTKVIGHNYYSAYLSIKMETNIDLGTTDPNKEIWALNFKEKTGEYIQVIDYVTDIESFLMLSENEFKNYFGISAVQNLNSAGFTFPNDLFRLPIQMALTAEGLEYVYNPEEIAPRSRGVVSFIISYEEIDGLLNLNATPYD